MNLSALVCASCHGNRQTYLDHPPNALAGFGCLLLGNLSSTLDYALRAPRDYLIDKARITRLQGREAVPLERKATNARHLGACDSSKRNGPRCTKVNLVHAHPGVAFGAVGHDAIVAGEGHYGTGSEAVAIDGSDGWDYQAMPISLGDAGG
jgi:hypothetical protein